MQAQTSILVKDGQDAGDEFGTAVSLSGNGQVMAVGAPYNSSGTYSNGQVRVYDKQSGFQLGPPINGASFERSGSTISLSQNGYRIAIGAIGSVRVYDFSGSDWIQVGNTLNGYQEGDFFGNAVSLSADGTRLAVGAEGSDSSAGEVRIFDLNGNTWSQVGSPIKGNPNSSLGYSVSLSTDGTTVAIGVPLEALEGG
ncbi:hypothetical protein BST85_09945 [Aureitalea marina]|uniref:PKD domain-containing protein n=2 Tax=Aureitalea marina TaxID=930804 RepID=A0A2S7KRB5_9FLAO|nr:hypothetical protein BST85_09945 [Aureitalea marina]